MDPDSPTSKVRVTEATGIENPSPGLVRDYLAMLSQQPIVNASSSSTAAPSLLNVPIVTHEPSQNDFMSGALPSPAPPDRAQGSHSPPIPSPASSRFKIHNNATICESDLKSMFHAMPHKLLTVRALRSYNVFHDLTMYSFFPDGFQTTVKGLALAYDDYRSCPQLAGCNASEAFFYALMMRGGVPRLGDDGKQRKVVYPEDLIPCYGAQLGDLYDREFWEEIGSLGDDVWGSEFEGDDVWGSEFEGDINDDNYSGDDKYDDNGGDDDGEDMEWEGGVDLGDEKGKAKEK